MKKMLTPIDLHSKSTPIEISGEYDWKRQVYLYDAYKFGTNNFTSNGTVSGQLNMQDDSTSDSISD